LSPAIIGLIGVVVGGAIGAFAQQLRPSARGVRGAARLVHEELGLTRAYATTVLTQQSWQPKERAFSDNQWSDRRALLAAELGLLDWMRVKLAYDAVVAIRAAKPRGTDPVPLSRDNQALLDRAVAEIELGRKALASLAGPFPTITQSLRRRRANREGRELLEKS
jgi:hypothetical protein